MTLYLVALAILWCTLWCVTALLLGALPKDSRRDESARRYPWSIGGLVARAAERRSLLFITVVVVFADVYVMSYAPTESAVAAGGLPSMRNTMDLYVPVQWMIDQTPLREPLLRGADHWGRRMAFENASAARIRGGHWGDTPPWLYGAGWALLGIVWIVVPPWFLRLGVLRYYRAESSVVAKECPSTTLG